MKQKLWYLLGAFRDTWYLLPIMSILIQELSNGYFMCFLITLYFHCLYQAAMVIELADKVDTLEKKGEAK